MPSECPVNPADLKKPWLIWKRIAINLFLLTVGSCLFAIGLNSILIPQRFLSGGVMGIALIFHYLLPKINTGIFYFILNIPLMLLGWFSVSLRFILYTAYGMASLALATLVINPGTITIDNPILAAILAGIISGAGAGITLRSQGSAGGLDILAVYLYKKLGLRMGATTTFISIMVLAVGAFFFDLEKALYSAVYVYANGKVIDAVLTGFNQRKSIFIISDCSDAIADQILQRLQRGVTFLSGVGGYTGEEKKVIFSIITLTELSKMRELVFDIDPQAFMVVNDTLEVLGKRHGVPRVY